MSFKIYTKTGDTGTTSLFGGKRVSKFHAQVESYGTIDELNSHIGLLADILEGLFVENSLQVIQNELFVLGSHLASDGGSSSFLPALEESSISVLEDQIDTWETQLSPLQNFILPGGHVAVSQCHVCRCVSRRAERLVVLLNEEMQLNPIIIAYLNRLSDYLFVMARYIAKVLNINEKPWIPSTKAQNL